MTQPGHWLRGVARRIFGADTMDRVIDPVIADLQFVDREAHLHGRRWPRVGVRLAGYTAFWHAVAAHIWHVSGTSIAQWIVSDQYAVGRTIAYSVAVSAVLMGFLVLLPLSGVPRGANVHFTAMLFLYRIPQAIPLAIVFGLPFGILLGTRGRLQTRRTTWSLVALAFAAAVLTFFVCAWLLPEANRLFRALVFAQVSGQGLPARSANELTFTELGTQITILKAQGRLAEARPLLWSYHGRLAASTAPFIWGIFALGLSRTTRRSPVRVITCLVAAITYLTYASGVVAAPAITYPWLPPEWVCWLPNALFALLTAALWMGVRSFSPEGQTDLARPR